MNNPIIEKQIIEQLQHLEEAQQKQVLDFTTFLANQKITGVSGKSLLRFASAISNEDLKLMSQAIEEECEQIDWDEW